MEQVVSKNDPLIRAYGLYWVREAVNWDKPALPGSRMNARATSKNELKKERSVDVWAQRGVYALYSEAKLVYVGLADSDKGIGDRLIAHHTKPRLSGRWDSFSWFGINGFDQLGKPCKIESITTTAQAVVRTMELILILAADPIMNRASGRFAGAERVNQREMIKQPTNQELMKALTEIKETLSAVSKV